MMTVPSLPMCEIRTVKSFTCVTSLVPACGSVIDVAITKAKCAITEFAFDLAHFAHSLPRLRAAATKIDKTRQDNSGFWSPQRFLQLKSTGHSVETHVQMTSCSGSFKGCLPTTLYHWIPYYWMFKMPG